MEGVFFLSPSCR